MAQTPQAFTFSTDEEENGEVREDTLTGRHQALLQEGETFLSLNLLGENVSGHLFTIIEDGEVRHISTKAKNRDEDWTEERVELAVKPGCRIKVRSPYVRSAYYFLVTCNAQGIVECRKL